MADQANEGYLSPWLQRTRGRMAIPYITGSILDIGCGNGYLAQFCSFESYHGYDIDYESLITAKKKFPLHHFSPEIPNSKFDTVFLLAVVEHITKIEEFFTGLLENLGDNGQIVVTTPHPWFQWVHFIGAKIGLFSAHANEEHEQLYTEKKMASLAEKIGLRVVVSKRFLLGANQLFVLKKTIP